MLPKTLLSLKHPLIKYLVSLRKDRSFRRKEEKVLVIGNKMVEELALQKTPIHTLLIEEKTPCSFAAKETFTVSRDILKKITGLPEPEQLAAVVSMPIFQDLPAASYIVALDGLSDPGNVGTLLRSALALGWDGVYFIDHCCDPFNDKALRAAKGATFRLPFIEGTWEDFLLFVQKRNIHVVLADKEGPSLKQFSHAPPLAVILSRESQGARLDAKSRFQTVSIPMQASMESLNVASAGAILLYGLKELL